MVIFQSDNGHDPHTSGSAGKWRGAKTSLLEGGIRVPTIFRFPRHISEGEVRRQPITNMDFVPTILEACNLPLPHRGCDGRSLWPVLSSPSASAPHCVLHWQWPIWAKDKAQWAVRKEDWKLIVNGRIWSQEDGRSIGMETPFLAKLSDKQPEKTNYAQKHPALVNQLTKLHRSWVEEMQVKEIRG